METKIVKIDKDNIDEDVINEAGLIIKNGGLVAFPTETVYGLGGDALNKNSSKKIYEAKGRPSDNPLIVHIADIGDIEKIAIDVPPITYELAKRFWPGPLTMILKKAECVPLETTGGLDTVAIRYPSNPIAQKFIKASGGFVAAPSANRSGKPSPTEGKYVIEDMDSLIEMIIDGGSSDIGLESTIIDLTSDEPMILRPGFVTKEDFLNVIENVSIDRTILDSSSGAKPKAPGMKYRHYAPSGELTIIHGEPKDVVAYINEEVSRYKAQGQKTGIIATKENSGYYRADVIKEIGNRDDDESIARNLFRILREMDDENVKVIFSEGFREEGIAMATMNRLLKAAGHKEVRV
ncbi:MAG: threonylcarbamoyl-AMP synthase [Lachnospiraceae bacterium]|nr:threonylcarbamoyl-AMP synthase [Lachnospiraceae bacterium]